VISLLEVDWEAQYIRRDGQVVDVVLIVLELAEGGDLFEYLAITGAFDELIARTFFHQLCDALCACHKAGVSHRDLKPENLLLDDSYQLKVSDFGMAKVFDDMMTNDVTHTSCGTDTYMAPEVNKVSTSGYSGTGVDIWAAGVVLFIMIAGYPPFQKPDTSDWWFNKLVVGRNDLFWKAHLRSATFSSEAQDLINAILMPDPAKRASLADIMQHPWYTGKTLSKSELKEQLQSRKLKVQMDNDTTVEAKGVVADDNFSDEIMRGLPRQPSLSEQTIDDLTQSLASQTLYDDTAGTTSTSTSDSVADIASSSLPQYDAKSTVATHTTFCTPARDIIQRMSGILSQMTGTHSVSTDKSHIRAKIVTPAGIVRMQMQLYQSNDGSNGPGSDSNSSQFIVQVRRTAGNVIMFVETFGQLVSQLGNRATVIV
jgi:serine/threonine protein kinase